MTIKNGKLGGVLGVTLLTIAALSTTSCDEENNPLGDLADACDLDCPAKGIESGNAAITGYASIDQFFSSVVKFRTTSASVAAGIDAEVKGIQAGFRITPAQLQAANGDLNAAIRAKVTAAVDGAVTVRAEPARCAVDARASFEAKARCEVSAGCNVDVMPPTITAQCQGSCEASVDVMASCEGSATLSCVVRNPNIMCTGQCDGQCTVTGAAAANCNGSCSGMCTGTCSVPLNADGSCGGTCTGGCSGSCTLSGQLNANCMGSCSGECTYTPAMATCEAGANVRCEAAANASVMCQGRCDGQVTPGSVDASCQAEASCEASAKADASLSVQCTPPSLEVDYKLKAGVDATLAADVNTGLNTLRARLPSLKASLKKADLVVKAGTSLTADANTAIMGAVNVLTDANVDAVARLRIGRCIPREVPKVAGEIQKGTTELNTQLTAATAVQASIGTM